MNISITDATSLGASAGLIDKALRTYGCDPAPLFAEAGINLNVYFDPNVRIPTTKLQTLVKLSLEATGDGGFGLTVAEQFQPALLQGLGFAWLASDTLHDALNRLVRYFRFINPFFKANVDESEDTLDLVFMGPESWPNYVYEQADTGMGIFLRMCQITVGEHIIPVRVVMQRPAPPCPDRFNAFFEAPIEYGAYDYRLCFDLHMANQHLSTSNPELARINDQAVIDYLARFDQSNITMKVRSRIIEQLPSGTARQESIAEELHLSLRSLQRKLKDEEITFKKLLEDTRRDLAMQYIRESRRPLGEIAYLLGFSEHSSFTRAFRRWTGHSPAQFRDAI